jgi:hypothetical protein
VTARATALAHALIESELSRIPEADRGEVASQVLGALTGRFLMIPHPTVAEEDATRAALAALEIPGLLLTIATKGPQ